MFSEEILDLEITRMKDSILPLNLKEIATESIGAGFSHDYYWSTVIQRRVYRATTFGNTSAINESFQMNRWKARQAHDGSSVRTYEMVFKSFSAGIIYALYRRYFSGKSTKSIQLRDTSRYSPRAYWMLPACVVSHPRNLNVNLNKIHNANSISMRKSIWQELFVEFKHKWSINFDTRRLFLRFSLNCKIQIHVFVHVMSRFCITADTCRAKIYAKSEIDTVRILHLVEQRCDYRLNDWINWFLTGLDIWKREKERERGESIVYITIYIKKGKRKRYIYKIMFLSCIKIDYYFEENKYWHNFKRNPKCSVEDPPVDLRRLESTKLTPCGYMLGCKLSNKECDWALYL